MSSIFTIGGKTVQDITIGAKQVQSIYDNTNQVLLWEKPAPNYFYFEDRSGAANSISLTKTGDQAEWLSLEYSTDKETWNTWDFSQTLTLPANGKVYLRGNNQKFSVSSGNYHYFGSTGDAYAGGSVISLYNKQVPNTINSNPTMFGFMFFGMTTLVGVDTNLFAGINYGSSGNWRDTTNMFYKTFSGCSSLVTPPDLSGLGYAKDNTFRETFSNCDLLESAAPMNVTEIDTSATSQFRSMYYHCFALVDASPLRIGFSTAVQYTFYQMFPDDRILATAPDLTSITTLGNQSMRLMLYNCKPLEVVKIGISAWGDFEDSTAADYNATYQWLDGVHSTGVFCKNSTLPVTRGVSNIPTNWSIADLNGKLYAPVITNTNNTITIAEAEGGASCQIWYTTDGTTPTPQNGTLYTQPFSVYGGTTVKAITHYNGTRSDLTTDSDVATFSLPLAAPVITDNNGTITISDPYGDPNVTIKYLVNGNVLNIDTNGMTYTEPLAISGDTHTLVAKLYKNGAGSPAGTYSNNYFYINNTGGQGTIEFVSTGVNTQDIEMSTDRVNWTPVSTNNPTTVQIGKTYLRMRQISERSVSNYITITTNFSHEYGGNLLSMVYGENFILTGTTNAERTLPTYCFYKMFYGDTLLSSINRISTTPNIIAGDYSFNLAFAGCTLIESGMGLRNIVGYGNYSFTRCYDSCERLKSVTAPDVSAINSAGFSYWLDGVYQIGDLYVSSGCTVASGTSGLPSGWTKIEM